MPTSVCYLHRARYQHRTRLLPTYSTRSMASYITGLLLNIQVPNVLGLAISSNNSGTPLIKFITMYRPELVHPKAESFEELHKMILFFADPSNLIDKSTQLSLVGLIRGTCSLAGQFNATSGPTTISVDGGAIVVVEVDKGFFMACSVTLPTDSDLQRRLVEIQIERLLQSFHRYFKVLHHQAQCIFSGDFQPLHEQILVEYYTELIKNYNGGALASKVKRALVWPNSLCYQGLFLYFPAGAYKLLSVRVPDSQRPDLEAIWDKAPVEPVAVFAAHLDKTIPKREGLIYKRATKVDDQAVLEVYRLIEFFSYHDSLNSRQLGQRSIFKGMFSESEKEASPPPEIEESFLLQLSPSTAIQLLHPASLAQTLVVLPLSTTLGGIKLLGLTMNEQIPSSWLPFYRGQLQEQTEEEAPVSEHSSVTSQEPSKGNFVMGPDEDGNIFLLLVYLPVTKDNKTKIEEFLVVLYVEDSILVCMIFESSAQELADPAFYETIRFSVCEAAVEIINDCVALTAGGMTLQSSISSLPKPVGNIINGRNENNEISDIDSDFFFIIYDTKEKSFQTSLPWLPQEVPQSLGKEVAQVSYQYQNAFFHLHDQLADYFVLRQAGLIFSDGAVKEHLHKYSTNKNNDWLMYFIRHRHKSIVIIRNYNSKHKQKTKINPKDMREASLWTSSIYDYAHLGFLDSLGDDVKVWLNLRSEAASDSA